MRDGSGEVGSSEWNEWVKEWNVFYEVVTGIHVRPVLIWPSCLLAAHTRVQRAMASETVVRSFPFCEVLGVIVRKSRRMYRLQRDELLHSSLCV